MITRSLFFVFVLAPYIIVGLPLQYLITRLDLPFWHVLPRGFHKLSRIFLGLKVRVVGRPERNRPVLLVANHISWTDIIAIGSVADVSFVAKSSIEKWFFVGLMASLQKTIYVDYNRKRDAGRTSQEMARRLAGNRAVLLFAEGHRDIGTHVQPFRSALIGAAQAAMKQAGSNNVAIQPVTIAYTRIQGLPISYNERAAVAGISLKSAGAVIRDLLTAGTKEVTIAFGPPVALKDGDDRKKLAAACEDEVRRTLVALNRAEKPPVPA